MAPGQEANGDNLGIFHTAMVMLSVLIRIASMRVKIRKFSYMFVFLSYRKYFIGTQNRVRISHGKRAIGVRAVEVRLFCVFKIHFSGHDVQN